MWFEVCPGVCRARIVQSSAAAATSPVRTTTAGTNSRSIDSSIFTSAPLLDLGRRLGFEFDRIVADVPAIVEMRSETDGRRARLGGQPGRQRRVIGVAVGHEDRPHGAAHEGGVQRVAMAVELRPGIDHHHVTTTDDVGPGAVVRELRRVLRDHPPNQRGDLLRRAVGERRRIEGQEVHGNASIRPTSRP